MRACTWIHLATGLTAVLLVGGGCVLPQQAVLVEPSCQRVSPGGKNDTLTFTVTIETLGLAGEQLVYEVTFHNPADKPIRSKDGRYENAAGAVAARRTFVVYQSPQTFEKLPLSIPAGQLQTRRRDWPLSAKFRVYTAAGQCLAEASCAVPSVPEQRPAPRVVPTAPRRPIVAQKPPDAAPRPERAAAMQPAPRSVGRRSTAPDDRAAPRERTSSPDRRTPERPSQAARESAPYAWFDSWSTLPGAWRAYFDQLPPLARNAAAPQGQRAAAAVPKAPPSRPDTPTEPPEPARTPDERRAAAAAPEPARDTGATTRPAARAPATRPAPSAPPVRKARYVVQKGDSLTRIALRILGDAGRWREIYDMNRDQLTEPDFIREGMVLWVPDESTPGAE